MSEEKKQYKGTVIWFDSRKGFGFVSQDHDDKDIFLHYSNIQLDGFKTVKPDQIVLYELGENKVGQQAVNVILLDDE